MILFLYFSAVEVCRFAVGLEVRAGKRVAWDAELIGLQRSMLAQLAQRIRERGAQGNVEFQEEGGFGGLGGRITIGEDCVVM